MNNNAGLSRIGAEGLSCGSCHQTRSGISSKTGDQIVRRYLLLFTTLEFKKFMCQLLIGFGVRTGHVEGHVVQSQSELSIMSPGIWVLQSRAD